MVQNQQKEYKVVVTDKTSATQIEAQLNDLAKEGWCLVSSYNVKNGTSPAWEKIIAIMERSVE